MASNCVAMVTVLRMSEKTLGILLVSVGWRLPARMLHFEQAP